MEDTEANLAIPRLPRRRQVRGEGRSQGPAGAGDHRSSGAASSAQRAGSQRHRQPDAGRDALEQSARRTGEVESERSAGSADGR